MGYDPDKYREKREKVLGIKKRGIGFGTLAGGVAIIIIAGLSVVTVPQAISYMSNRHLDDAIFKLDSQAPNVVLENIAVAEGVKAVKKNKAGLRLVVTFDRRKINLSSIRTRFEHHDVPVTLLNQVNHLQHMAVMKKEEEELETP